VFQQLQRVAVRAGITFQVVAANLGVAACCSELLCVVVSCRVLQQLQRVAVRAGITVQVVAANLGVAACCSVLQRVVECCSVLLCVLALQFKSLPQILQL